MKVVKNYLWNVSYQLFVIVVPIITMPYISRVLGPSGIGINSYTGSVVQYFIIFSDLGMSIYANREIAYVRDNREKLSQVFWELLFLRLITTFASMIAYSVFIYFTSDYQYYFLIQSISLIAAGLDVSWLYMGLENFRITVLRNLTIKILSLVLIFTTVKTSTDTGRYIFITCASTLLGNIALMPYLKPYINLPKFHGLNPFRHFRMSIIMFVPQVAMQIYTMLNRTMLGKFVSVNAAGYYDSSDKIIRILLAVATGTGSVLLPHIANQFVNGEVKKLKNIFRTSFDFVSFITFSLSFGISAVSHKFVLLFFGSKFLIVGNLLIIESIAAIFIAWDNAVGSQYLLPTKQTSKFTNSVLIGALINIIVNIPLIHWFGVMGSMWATVLCEFCVTTCMLIQIRKQLQIHSLFTNPGLFMNRI